MSSEKNSSPVLLFVVVNLLTPQITADQSDCDTQLDVLTLTCALDTYGGGHEGGGAVEEEVWRWVLKIEKEDGIPPGNWVSNGKLLLIVSVYAPQELTEKKMLWEYLMHVMASWKGDVIIMGDFNEVRYSNERFGSNFNVKRVNAFNSFTIQAGLEEIPLGGCSFTWCHKSGSKMSKLDRFLVSESLLSVCPNLSSITLDRFLSNHRPILLRESTYDYGPIPFRFFKYWVEVDGFEKLIVET
nr:RNA-directed DNA polymerase, eukaryota [Tanacetum cinerariifolium]